MEVHLCAIPLPHNRLPRTNCEFPSVNRICGCFPDQSPCLRYRKRFVGIFPQTLNLALLAKLKHIRNNATDTRTHTHMRVKHVGKRKPSCFRSVYGRFARHHQLSHGIQRFAAASQCGFLFVALARTMAVSGRSRTMQVGRPLLARATMRSFRLRRAT